MSKSEYLPFQYEDLRYWWNELNGRGGFAWDCGTGKTFVAKRIVRWFAEQKKTVLIVVPTSLLRDWYDELVEFGITDVTLFNKPKADLSQNIIVTTYGRLEKLKNRKFDLVIADECHYIKSSTSKRGKAFRKIASNSKHLLMLSGTISQNRDVDELLNYLWSIDDPVFVNKVAKNITEFRNNWQNHVPLPNGGRIYYTVPAGAKVVNDYVQKYFRFRRLNEIADLPDRHVVKIETPSLIKIDLSDIPADLREQVAVEYEEPHIIHALMMGNGIDPFTKEMKNTAKIERILSILDDLGQTKVIIWTWFKSFNTALLSALRKEGYNPLFIDGSVSQNKRQSIIEKFKTNGYNILIATVGTLAEGFNLQFVNYEIHANIIYDSIKYEQATRRIYRIGQNKKVISYHLIGKKSLEEYALKVLERKMSKREAIDYLTGVLAEKYMRRRK